MQQQGYALTLHLTSQKIIQKTTDTKNSNPSSMLSIIKERFLTHLFKFSLDVISAKKYIMGQLSSTNSLAPNCNRTLKNLNDSNYAAF